MPDTIQCVRDDTDKHRWLILTAAGAQMTPWTDDAPWEKVWRYFLEQGVKAEWLRDREAKLPT